MDCWTQKSAKVGVVGEKKNGHQRSVLIFLRKEWKKLKGKQTQSLEQKKKLKSQLIEWHCRTVENALTGFMWLL